jgi:hypothetical protein
MEKFRPSAFETLIAWERKCKQHAAQRAIDESNMTERQRERKDFRNDRQALIALKRNA